MLANSVAYSLLAAASIIVLHLGFKMSLVGAYLFTVALFVVAFIVSDSIPV